MLSIDRIRLILVIMAIAILMSILEGAGVSVSKGSVSMGRSGVSIPLAVGALVVEAGSIGWVVAISSISNTIISTRTINIVWLGRRISRPLAVVTIAVVRMISVAISTSIAGRTPVSVNAVSISRTISLGKSHSNQGKLK